MVVKTGSTSTVRLKLQVPFLLQHVECSSAATVTGWSEAHLNTATTISFRTSTTSSTTSEQDPPVKCTGLEALHAVVSDDSVVVRSLCVRFQNPCITPQRLPQQQQQPTAAACAATGSEAGGSTPPPAAPADIWAELDVSGVRANAYVCANPALLASWRLLLPRLVTHARNEASSSASSTPTPTPRAETPKGVSPSVGKAPGVGSGRSEGLELRALDTVYASLKPGVNAQRWRGDGTAAAVGPAPGASGLNALPAAVVMKVAQYLPAASLDAFSVSCKGQHHTCSTLVPGLTLDLFPHQKKGLRWMRHREHGRPARPHPEFVPVDTAPVLPAGGRETASLPEGTIGVASGGRGRPEGARPDVSLPSPTVGGRLWVNVVDGIVWPSAPAPCPEVRGGMLCDEPGLGKTITVLALLLRTRGLLPGAVPLPLGVSSSTRSGSVSAEEQWRNWGSLERQGAMMKVVRALQMSDPAGMFSRVLDEETLEELGMPDYVSAVGEPIDLQTIARRACSRGPRDSVPAYGTFQEFASDVRKVFSNAIAYHGGGGDDATVSDRSSGGGGGGGGNGDASVGQSVTSVPSNEPTNEHKGQSHGRARAMPKVAEAAEELSREAEDLLKGVFVARRIDRGEALVERLRALKASSATLIVVPPPMLPHWRNQFTLHAEHGRLGPVFFDERSDTRLPPVEELKEFGVVVTTYQRLTNEQPGWSDSPLSRIHWLRMVLDEGHAMGTSAMTSCGEVARRIEAERRWVMTGTPTPTTSADAALRNLSNLLNLLREKEYSPEWRRNVRAPFIANKPEGRERLKRLLSEVMIRHTKADLPSIPPPVRESALLNMSQQETLAYDTIVSFVRSNLLLTSMEGKTSGWQDSLLNPANTKYAMEALTNIRLSCCGGGTLIPMVKGIHHAETLEMLRDLHNASVVDLRRIDNFMTRATMGEVSSCQGCGEPLQLLHITPCTHLICVDCVDCVNNACRVCGSRYDVDDFQRLQPGFELKWMYNIREQERLHQQRRAAARLARRGTPGNNQANSTPASPSSPDVAIVHQAMSPHQGGGGASSGTGGGGSSRPSPPGAGSPASPGGGGGLEVEEEGEELEMHSKAFYAIEQLKGIRDKAASSNRRRGDYRPLKAIVFSQFLPVLNIVGDKFLRELGSFPEEGWQRRGEKCVAEFWGKNRAKELERFRTDPECLVLLLGKRGAHGLDLSFVTHMFLMDQIWDRSLETQVVARANRMGAKGSVSVVQLIMKDTMEQELRSYVNSDKTRNAATIATPGSRRGSLPPANGSRNGHTAHPSSPLRGAGPVGGVDDRFPANGGVGGSTPTPPRKKPREKSPWEGRGKKRPRSGGSVKRVAGSGSGLSASSRQEHAKVHFLLTSLRSSKAASAQEVGGRKDKEEQRDGEEEEEEEDGEGGEGASSSARQGNGKGKGKGKGKKAVRRGVTFAEDVVVVQDKAAAVEDPRWMGEAAAGGGATRAASPDRVVGWSS